MELEFYQELLLSAVFSVLIAFLIGKIAVIGASDGELTVNASISTDRAVRASTGDKSEGSSSKEAEASSDRSKTEEELVCLKQVEEKNIATETDMTEVEKEFIAEMAKVVENLADCGDVFKEEEEMEVERPPCAVITGHVKDAEILVESGNEAYIREDGSLLHGEEEWEGIEKSELEKLFSVATEYARSSSGAAALSRLSTQVQMELYGLNKIATEGPCYESQPLPLNFSARAKWQAWQRLGNMIPDVAMERYISLLSKNIPGWVDLTSGEDAKCGRGNESPADFSLPSQHQLSTEIQMISEDLGSVDIDHVTERSTILEQGALTGFASTFILNLLSPTRGAFLTIYW